MHRDGFVGRAGKLIALLPDHSDAYTRGKIIELLGYTASSEAREVAARYKLEHPEEWSEVSPE